MFRLAETYWEKSKFIYQSEFKEFDDVYTKWVDAGRQGKEPQLAVVPEAERRVQEAVARQLPHHPREVPGLPAPRRGALHHGVQRVRGRPHEGGRRQLLAAHSAVPRERVRVATRTSRSASTTSRTTISRSRRRRTRRRTTSPRRRSASAPRTTRSTSSRGATTTRRPTTTRSRASSSRSSAARTPPSRRRPKGAGASSSSARRSTTWCSRTRSSIRRRTRTST